MNWTRTEDKDPDYDDIPFMTYDKYGLFEVWEDVDFFCELTELERCEITHWAKISEPIK